MSRKELDFPIALLEMLLDELTPEEKMPHIKQMIDHFKEALKIYKCHVPAIIVCVHGATDAEDDTSLTHSMTEHSKIGDVISEAILKLAEEEGAERLTKEVVQ